MPRLTRAERELRDWTKQAVVDPIEQQLGKRWQRHYTEDVQMALVAKQVMSVASSWAMMDRRNDGWRKGSLSQAQELVDIQFEAYRQLGILEGD